MTSPSLHCPWSLRGLVGELRSGRTTAEAARERALARIAETEPLVHAWVDLAPPHRAGTPDRAATSRPLDGVPIGVKDIIDLAGFPTKCGTPLRADADPAVADAAIVRAWRAAGTRPLGKTVTTEFAYFCPGPTANPAGIEHTPGGSSSGSAAAVAAGQVPLALGTQTAGSITRPAAYCGVASLVMSADRLPMTGVVGLSPSLDCHGVFAASIDDLALAWSAFTGAPDVGEADLIQGPVAPPRVLLWQASAPGEVESSMADALAQAELILRGAGATVDTWNEEALIAEITAAHSVVMAWEAARVRADELAVAHRLTPPLVELLRTGGKISEVDLAIARAVIDRGAAAVTGALADYDLVLGPAATGPAPRGLDRTGDPIMSRPWQAMGLPAVAIPAYADDHGMPLGLQAIGSRGGEADLLRHAGWIERTLPDPSYSESPPNAQTRATQGAWAP